MGNPVRVQISPRAPLFGRSDPVSRRRLERSRDGVAAFQGGAPRGMRLNPFRGWNPALWAGWMPNGMGQVKPNHFGDIARTVWRNRDRLPYAWRILTRGVCDGCALGTT